MDAEHSRLLGEVIGKLDSVVSDVADIKHNNDKQTREIQKIDKNLEVVRLKIENNLLIQASRHEAHIKDHADTEKRKAQEESTLERRFDKKIAVLGTVLVLLEIGVGIAAIVATR